jgi:hypothetical protein
MRESIGLGALALGVTALAACAADAPAEYPPPVGDALPAQSPVQAGVSPVPVAVGLASVTEAALADAARRTGLKRGDLKVLSADAVTWPDGSLGCPQPGMLYTQALVPGYRVRIEADGQVLDYHAGMSGRPTFCPAERSKEPIPAEASRI